MELSSLMRRPECHLSGRVGIGYAHRSGSSMTVILLPCGASASEAVSFVFVCMLMDSEWHLNTGTRTVVAVIAMSGSSVSSGLLYHLPLFFCVAHFLYHVYVRNEVEGYLMVHRRRGIREDSGFDGLT